MLFARLLKDGVVILYMDDLIIPSHDEQKSIDKLKLFLKTAAELDLDFNFKKSNFSIVKLTFLVTKSVTVVHTPSQVKTKVVLHFPEPTCTEDSQKFLELTGYLRKFINGYSIIAKPFSDLLKHNVEFNFGLDE